MDNLIALCHLIDTERVENIDIFDKKKHTGKAWQLYDAVIKGKITSDDEGKTLLYGEEGSRHDYNRLKARLEKKLLNATFFLQNDSIDHSERKKARFDVARSYSLMQILLNRLDKRSGIKIAKKAYKKAAQYEMTDFTLLTARILYDYYSINNPSKKKMLKYETEINDLEKTLSHELKVEKFYNRVSHIYLTQKSKFSPVQIGEMKSYVDQILELKQTCNSFKFYLNSYNIITSYYILIDDYDNSIKYCQEALQKFDLKPFEDRASKWMFRNSLILAFVGKRKYSLAEKYCIQNFKILQARNHNWYIQCNYYFIILSAQGKFQELYSLVLDVSLSKKYKTFLRHHEYWNVNEAYIQFLIRMKKVDPDLDSSKRKLRPFSITRFLNDVPKFSKDKRGLNISILVIQFLFLILDRKYSKLIDRLDALKQYAHRYLKNDETYRSNLFIKMLLKVADANFNPVATQRHTKELYAKLLASTPSANFQSAVIEVIQYEMLWKIVMELLEENRMKKST